MLFISLRDCFAEPIAPCGARNGKSALLVSKKSDDEGWDSYMDEYVGLHGIITDPDTSINDPDALVEISLDRKGTHRFPQDCLKILED